MATELKQAEDDVAAQPHSVESDSAQLRRSAQRLADQAVRLYRWRSLLWWLAVALLVTIALVTGDYLLHAEETGLRWLLTASWLAGLAFAAWRWLPPAWHFALGPVRVAQWIERSRPDLHDHLSNVLAIAELPESDLRYGSASFRHAAVTSAAREPLDVDWRSYLDWRPTLRAAAAAIALGLIAFGLTLAAPHIAGRGVARLLIPWRALPWPHADELQFVNLPAMIASGSELPIEVIDRRPPLPSALELQVLAPPDQPNGPKRLVRLPMRILDDVALATITDMRGDFSVRVVGGDDQDGVWTEVRVVELPELLDERFHVTPPAYSRQPVTELVGDRIEVLSGSKVVFHGRYSSPMRSIIAEPLPTAAAGNETSSLASSQTTAPGGGSQSDTGGPTSWPATLSADRQAFDLFLGADGGLVIDSDRRWRLRFETEDGLEVDEPKTWSIHVLADRPPSVNLVPIEPLLITRDSVVPIVGQAADDLELVEVQFVWQSGEGDQPHKQTLWRPADEADTASADSAPPGASNAAKSVPPRQATLDFQWRPSEERLSLGQVTVYLEARDSLGQVTRSVSQTLQVQDSQSVLAHLQAEEAKAFEPLRQLLNAQRRNAQAIKRAHDIAEETETLSSQQLDALATARQLQQSIAQQLARSPGSILSKLQQLGQQLQRNSLDDTELARQVERLVDDIQRLDAESIEPALNALDSAQQSMRTAIESSATEAEKNAASTALAATAASQHEATAQLSRIVDSVATAETMASLQKQFGDLERRQNELRSETERFQVERVAHPENRTADATRIGLRSDQLSLARNIDELIATIDQQLSQSSSEREDVARTALEKARQALVDQQVSQTMRDAADKVDAEQLAEGIKAQRTAANAIARAAAQFGGGSAPTLQSSTENLQAMAQQLGGLADQQTQLASEMQAPNASQSAKDLAQQQATLAEAAAQVSDELERQSNHSLSEAVGEAKRQASEAARQAAESSLALAATSAQQAAQEFREAQQMAEQRVSELERQLATQQLLDLGGAVTDLIRRQKPVVEKLTQLQQTSAAASERPADWASQLRDAAATQEVVRQQLLETSSRMQELDTFAWLLDQCEIDMSRAVAALEREQLEPDGLASAGSALRKLDAAAQALDSSNADSTGQDSTPADAAGSNNESSGGGDESAKKRRPSLASLRLLRALQDAINEQTKTLNAQGKDAQGPEQLRLADEQQALAEQTQKLMQDILKRK